MSLGANLSSGHTNKLTAGAICCRPLPRPTNDTCGTQCIVSGQKQPVAAYPSMVLSSNKCPQPTPAEIALYPKASSPSSVRTESLANPPCNITNLEPSSRFSKYNRYQPAVPCQPLPQSANMAGISKPSIRQCN
jgi:hypothetical protein